ncbi:MULTISPECIES: Uma2 family endonuclease [unclassified Coleofasciculus]|uniref:Uma2 family endonuclease n=1 Tax=unclassified Coleofasciculus TaxID=2692782 RepID=UPI00187E9498|nr:MULTISPECIES: Uma2 family endonuclease [unclassified Coleofasciculus]MBE9127327.1 Uma2 family endonuclease [Coleofasciculus sp. LEGE 07081]MBE9150913.1 Uma2 family endonuclease [Coleofasciculus sp. LEGE 07092]
MGKVPEYWIVDLKHRRVTVLREPADGNYRSEQTLTAGEITPIAFPNVTVSVQRWLEGF